MSPSSVSIKRREFDECLDAFFRLKDIIENAYLLNTGSTKSQFGTLCAHAEQAEPMFDNFGRKHVLHVGLDICKRSKTLPDRRVRTRQCRLTKVAVA